MKRSAPYWLLLVFYQATMALGQTVDTSVSGVLRITPEDRSIYAPVFSPFCDDIVWLGKLTWQLSAQRFLPADSSKACIPEKARRRYFGTDPKSHIYVQWKTDPYDIHYFWAFEYRRDTLFMLRYDRDIARLDSFVSLPFGRGGADFAIGKAGIWVVNDQGLVLHDPHTGVITQRIGKPAEGYVMNLRTWGEDVLLTDRWLYRQKENRYEDFFPLPEDMKGCKSPNQSVFFAEACISNTVGGAEENATYLIAAGYKPIQLPFKPHWNIRRYDLAVNAPVAWFSFPDKVLAFDFSTGDSIVYLGNTGEPLNGDQAGRFLGFRSEKGLSFFDKNSCQFRVLDKTYGFETPRNFISDQRYIYFTYENHWDIIDFSKLALTFHRSTILEGFNAFDLERKAIEEGSSKDFYAQYEAYHGLLKKYKTLENPKIEAEWNRISNQLGYLLYQAPDSLFVRVGMDYLSGRFSPKLSCGIVQSLFSYWCRKMELEQAHHLLEIAGNEACIEEGDQSGAYSIQMLRTTQHSFDSIAALKIQPDERLYALGRVWWDYCIAVPGLGYFGMGPKNVQKPFDFFKTLLKIYPESPWADNAAYDTLYFIDYHPQSNDDYTPEGNDNKAYLAFTQFLKDYPTSDRRPDILVRLADVIQRGVYDNNYKNIDKESADDYRHTVATEYPNFAKNSKAYKESLARQNQYQWSNRWNITLAFNQEKYHLDDSIFVTVQLQNRSRSPKTLDNDFLQDWHKGLKLQLSKAVDRGCEGLWGDFPLLPLEAHDSSRTVNIEPRAYYTETFLLGLKSYTKRYYPGSFELESGASYDYHLEFRLEQFSWLWVAAKNRGTIRVE